MRRPWVGRRGADHRRLVLDVLQLLVARPAVTDDGAAGGDRGGDEGAERDRRAVADHREPDPARPLAPDLDSTGHEQLAAVRPSGPSAIAPGAKGQTGL